MGSLLGDVTRDYRRSPRYKTFAGSVVCNSWRGFAGSFRRKAGNDLLRWYSGGCAATLSCSAICVGHPHTSNGLGLCHNDDLDGCADQRVTAYERKH